MPHPIPAWLAVTILVFSSIQDNMAIFTNVPTTLELSTRQLFVTSDILSQWAWFSMSTRNFIGSAKNSAHQLLDGYRVQQLCGVVAYLMRANIAYRVTHLYANEIYTSDELHAMILFSGLKHLFS